MILIFDKPGHLALRCLADSTMSFSRGTADMSLLRNVVLGVVLVFSSSVSLAEQTVVVVLDDSGSMDERLRTSTGRVRRMDAAKKALLEVLRVLPTDTRVGVLTLNTQVNQSHWVVPLGSAKSSWGANIERIEADGGTPLGEFLKVGADELLQARSASSYGTYRLLIVTDGEANDRELVAAFVPQILARGIGLDVIGVGMGAEHSLATQAHSYRAADDDASLTQAISEVFAETSPNDQNAQEDFELIAGLPDGFAEQALQALTKVNNKPLDVNVESKAVSFGYSGSRSSGSGRSAGATAVFETLFGGILCCFGTFVGFGFLMVVLFGTRKPPRRRR